MKATQFIQDHGLERAREVVEGAPEWAIFWITQGEYHISMLSFPNMTGHHSFLISEVKRLVESVDLITKVGGLKDAKEEHVKWMHAPDLHTYRIGVSVERLEQAIADYESIYGEGNEQEK
ncbi:hypothetical protein [Acinetobacter lactucae]|uniref:Uncharacterized protein n=1 Tax=Acinetobacter lactucae TaxID=1785128 RepID=R8Z182_9GAMM|nr:hypothetical protein [Acinetobacter lactucae]EOQ73502.1 hypothetical protein F929_03445 [Acinetobacter lactucae]